MLLRRSTYSLASCSPASRPSPSIAAAELIAGAATARISSSHHHHHTRPAAGVPTHSAARPPVTGVGSTSDLAMPCLRRRLNADES